MNHFLKWNNNYELGNPKIDDQHKKIVNLINLLYMGIKQKKGNKIIKHTLQEMMEYSIEHFSTEDQLMEKYPYPQSDFHLKEHKLYIEKSNEMYHKYMEGNSDISQETLNFLKNWWESHILQTDKVFIQFLKDFHKL
jgi:hemerythrin-like metal-binding protein